MNRPVAIFDVDDTLNDFWPPIIEEAERLGKSHPKKEDLTEYDSFLEYMTEDEFKKLACRMSMSMNPNQRIVSDLKYFNSEGYSIIISTNRAYMRRYGYNPEQLTKSWLAYYGIPYHNIFVTPDGWSKAQYLREVLVGRDVHVVYEDNVDNINDIANSPFMNPEPLLCLVDQPWNRKREVDFDIDYVCRVELFRHSSVAC